MVEELTILSLLLGGIIVIIRIKFLDKCANTIEEFAFNTIAKSVLHEVRDAAKTVDVANQSNLNSVKHEILCQIRTFRVKLSDDTSNFSCITLVKLTDDIVTVVVANTAHLRHVIDRWHRKVVRLGDLPEVAEVQRALALKGALYVLFHAFKFGLEY